MPNSAEWFREYYKKNRERRKAHAKKWRDKNAEAHKAGSREYYWKNRDRVMVKNRDRAKANRKKYSAINTRYVLNRRKTDALYQLKHRVRARIATALRKKQTMKTTKTEILIGCRIDFFREFLENQFVDGMTWDNHGTHWQIDHIIPLNSFDLSSIENQKKAFHYSNCRPLIRAENIAKSDSMPEPHQALLL